MNRSFLKMITSAYITSKLNYYNAALLSKYCCNGITQEHSRYLFELGQLIL